MHPATWRRHQAAIQAEVMQSHYHEHAIRNIVNSLPAAGTTLCVGCGDGTELHYFHQSVGVTLNAQGLIGKRIVVADMHELPFASKSFDAIFCRDCFEHALAPSIVLSEFTRIARQWIALVIPDQTWSGSPLHPLVPTCEQVGWMSHKLGWTAAFAKQKLTQEPDEHGISHEWDEFVCLLAPAHG